MPRSSKERSEKPNTPRPAAGKRTTKKAASTAKSASGSSAKKKAKKASTRTPRKKGTSSGTSSAAPKTSGPTETRKKSVAREKASATTSKTRAAEPAKVSEPRKRGARRAGSATKAPSPRPDAAVPAAVEERAQAVDSRETGAGTLSEPEAAPPTIPPLPVEEDDDEIVPFEDDDEPAPDAPPDASPREILEAIRRGGLHVSALSRLDDDEVATLARSMGLGIPPGERREETLYRLLQAPAGAAATQATTYVEGLLELHPDGYGFLRRPDRSYTQQADDVYVAAGLIRRLHLRPGHWVSGTARRTRPHEPLLALHRVEEVNHEDVAHLAQVTDFESLTVVYPDQRFLLETRPDEVEMRVMDLFCPLGRGQRALIVSPPRAGKTIMLQKLADAIAHNSPNVDIVVLLVDERPEEVTNMRRSVRGEVIASTFDRPPSNHVRVAELVMEKVKRMVEYGRHVVLLLDSITRLGRAYNNLAGPSGRILTGGLEAKALTRPKRFFGAARNIEDGGSLTIIATSLVDTGSRMDDVIFEEFKGSGNMEVVLDRDLANARIWPAINIPASGTRNEDLLLHPEELRRINLLRKALAGRGSQGVMETLVEMMKQYRTNAELLMSIQ